MGTNFLESLGSGSYGTAEGTPSKDNQAVIDSFKQTINPPTLPGGVSLAWTPDKKANVIGLLTQIETMISQNRADTQLQMATLSQSENIIKKQIQDLDDSSSVLSDLQKQNIDRTVQNVANTEFEEFHSKVSEYNYRLACISQNKEDTKSLLLEYDMYTICESNNTLRS